MLTKLMQDGSRSLAFSKNPDFTHSCEQFWDFRFA
jgi:hypothetical protein